MSNIVIIMTDPTPADWTQAQQALAALQPQSTPQVVASPQPQAPLTLVAQPSPAPKAPKAAKAVQPWQVKGSPEAAAHMAQVRAAKPAKSPSPAPVGQATASMANVFNRSGLAQPAAVPTQSAASVASKADLPTVRVFSDLNADQQASLAAFYGRLVDTNKVQAIDQFASGALTLRDLTQVHHKGEHSLGAWIAERVVKANIG